MSTFSMNNQSVEQIKEFLTKNHANLMPLIQIIVKDGIQQAKNLKN
jgi:hypothetical protein